EVGSTVTLTVSSGPEPVVVPDVRGMTVTEASQALSDANLLLGEQVQVESDEVEEGRIVEQDPAAGQQVPPGTAVTVQVSSGAGTVTVPDVTGRTEGEARATLEGAGFRV